MKTKAGGTEPTMKTFSCERRARDRSPRNAGEQLDVFESPPLAWTHAAWDDPGPDAQGGQRSIWLEPNLGSFQHKNFFWLHDNGEF